MRGGIYVISAVLLAASFCIPPVSAAEEPVPYFITRPNKPPVRLFLTPSEARAYGSFAPGYMLEQEGTFLAAATPNDPLYDEQDALQRIHASSLWDEETGSRDVVVAVIDSGVDLDHPDLADNIWTNAGEVAGNGIDDDENGYIDDVYGWDFVADNNDPGAKLDGSYVPGNTDGVNHGTLVAGVIGAVGNNGRGITGVAWRVHLMPLRVLNSAGVGLTSSIVEALDYARSNGADVVNMSLVGSQYSAALEAAIREVVDAGVVVVAAAGNEGVNLDTSKRYPVCMSGVVGVASVNSADVRSSFSNYGSSCADIAAPGEGIYTTQALLDATGFSEGYAGGWAGTSLASPFVAGAAAIIKAAHPTWQQDVIIRTVRDTAHSLSDARLGAGRLELQDLVQTQIVDAPVLQVLTAPGPGGGPDVRTFTLSGRKRKSVLAYAPTYRNGVNITSGDIADVAEEEIITGTFAGGGPHVRAFAQDGSLVTQFFAYAESFRGGVDVAAGDVDGDGTTAIVTAPGPGGGPDIRIFTGEGVKRKSILAFAPWSRTGTHVAVGDVNGDGKGEIITAEMSGGTPLVKVFTKTGVQLSQFYAYAESFRGGVDVAAGDVDGDGYDEIITAPGPGGGPHVRIFSMHGSVEGQFFAYATSFRGGVRVASADLDGDTVDDVIVGPMAGGGPQVRAFRGDGSLAGQFFAYPEAFRGGIDVGGGRVF